MIVPISLIALMHKVTNKQAIYTQQTSGVKKAFCLMYLKRDAEGVLNQAFLLIISLIVFFYNH